MDPNATLAAIRQLSRRIIDEKEAPDGADATALADACEALDEYMTNGGFAPDAWLASRLAMLQAEYRRGFEAAMMRKRAERRPLQMPGAPMHASDPLGGPHPGVNGFPPDTDHDTTAADEHEEGH